MKKIMDYILDRLSESGIEPYKTSRRDNSVSYYFKCADNENKHILITCGGDKHFPIRGNGYLYGYEMEPCPQIVCSPKDNLEYVRERTERLVKFFSDRLINRIGEVESIPLWYQVGTFEDLGIEKTDRNYAWWVEEWKKGTFTKYTHWVHKDQKNAWRLHLKGYGYFADVRLEKDKTYTAYINMFEFFRPQKKGLKSIEEAGSWALHRLEGRSWKGNCWGVPEDIHKWD